MACLQQVIRSIKLRKVRKGNSQVTQHLRLPIMPNILITLHSVWQYSPDHSAASLLWAAACLAFLDFLRTVEFTIPSAHSSDGECHLCTENVAVDNSEHPSCLHVLIKQSKTDPFRQGCTLVHGRTGKILCPVSSLMAFLVTRGSQSGLLFTSQDGSYLTRACFVQELKRALTTSGIDADKYNGHNFRIGAPLQRKVLKTLIQTLGKWKSTAYLLYVKYYST